MGRAFAAYVGLTIAGWSPPGGEPADPDRGATGDLSYGCMGGGADGAVPQCPRSCDDVGDGMAPGARYDQDNARGEEGWCRGTGCNADAEGQDAFMSRDFACVELPR